MTSFPMDLDVWSPFGGQLTPFDVPTFDLLTERSDACDYGLFDDDITTHLCHNPNLAWSSHIATGYESRSSMTLASSPEQYGLLVKPENVLQPARQLLPVRPASPVPELPRSPENYFAEFISYQPIREATVGLVPAFSAPLSSSPVIAAAYSTVPSPKQLPVTDLEVAICDWAVVPDVQELDDVAGGEEDMLFELDDVDSDVVIDQEKLASIGPVLTPVSLDDVLSLLPSEVPSTPSSSPQSDTIVLSGSPVVLSAPCLGIPAPLCIVPAAVSAPGSFLLEKIPSVFDHTPTGSPSPGGELIPIGYTPLGSPVSVNSGSVGSPAGSVASPPAVRRPVERRQRKKEQNKTAAQRYREKKRSEHGTVMSEYELLEKRNEELRIKVQDMTKEIAYLKGLIEEICA